MSKTLIAYYSRANQNYVNGMIENLEVGNTQIVASRIHELTGGDIFKIEPEVPYSKDYNKCIQQAKLDQQNHHYPKLKSYLASIDDYEVIYLGFPNYWNTMPMAVFSFLKHYNFDNKVVHVFCTHEGSGLGNSIKDLQMLCPQAIISKTLAIKGNEVNDCNEKLEQWIKEEEVMDNKELSVFPIGDKNDAYAAYFINQSYLKTLSSEQVGIYNVTFEPKCRNNWHIHHASKGGGQILIVVAGEGWYQEWNQPARKLKPGDVVNIKPGVKHWHGASANSWFQHLAIEVPGENTSNEWLEAVDDEQYLKLK